MSKSIILTCEERRPERDVLVHADGIVERDVDVQESVSEERDEVAAHGDEQWGVCKHHRAGRTASDRHSVAADPTQSGLFTLDGENCAARKIPQRPFAYCISQKSYFGPPAHPT